jgi:hypothetical protein
MGAVDGTITDATGGVLHDVHVRISGPATMLAREDVSRKDGYYRITALPPGEYLVTFTHADFQAATRTRIRVSAGSTTHLPVTLELARREEIAVASGARLVDPHASAITSVINAAQLSLLPGSRSTGAILSVTPAVLLNGFDVGGHRALAPGVFSVYGITGYNRPTLEGISISQHNRYGFSPDYGSFEEVRVGLGAYGPEWPTPGLHMQVITKSGGNQYRGAFYAAFADGRWQAHNIDAGQVTRGAPRATGLAPEETNRLNRYHDVNADVGGRLKRDRAWWYLSWRDQRVDTRVVTFPAEPIESRATAATVKATVRLGTAGSLVVFANPTVTQTPIQLGAFLRSSAIHVSRDSTSEQAARGTVWKAEWNATRRSLFAEVRVGQFIASREERPASDLPRVEDLADPAVLGGNRAWRDDLHRDQVSGSVSRFTEGFGGRHHLRAGVDIERTMAAETWQRGFPGDVLHVLRSGHPAEVYLFQTPSRSEFGQWWTSAFVSDSWQVQDRLTLNIGARYDRFRIFLPAQHHPAGRFTPTATVFPAVDNVIGWNVIAPRFGASFDATGDGRTLIKVSYSRYWLPPTTDLAFNVNPNGRVWWERFAWSDDNGDRLWQPGEESTQPLERRGGTALESVNPDLKLAYVHEIAWRIEREITARVAVTTGIVWRGERQQGLRQLSPAFETFSVTRTFSDPGPSGSTLSASADGAGIRLFDVPPGVVAPSEIVVRNVPRSDSDYVTWELAANRRIDGRWSLGADVAHTWNRDHESSYLGQAVRANEYAATPNDLVNTDPDGRHVFRVWSARVHATWDGPWGLQVIPLLRHQSGQPFGRTVLAPLSYGTIRVLAEPIGSRRQDHLTLLDLRMQKTMRVRGGSRVSAFVEVFNVFNGNAEQQVTWASGSAFLRPLSIVPPRIARAGMKVGW